MPLMARERCATSHSFGLRPSIPASPKRAMDSGIAPACEQCRRICSRDLIHQRAPDFFLNVFLHAIRSHWEGAEDVATHEDDAAVLRLAGSAHELQDDV